MNQTPPEGRGVCPVCGGSCRVDAGDKPYTSIVGYDAATNTYACNNCGGQYQFGHPTGHVRLRPDGTPCKHTYFGRNAGKCYTEYTCRDCKDSHYIDSGD